MSKRTRAETQEEQFALAAVSDADQEPLTETRRTRSGRKIRTPAALLASETSARTPSRRTRRSVLQEVPKPDELPKDKSREPAVSTEKEPPAPSTDTEPPAMSNETEPPAMSTETEPPAMSTETEPPAMSTETEPPAMSSETEPPAMSTDTEPPAMSTDTEPQAQLQIGSAPADIDKTQVTGCVDGAQLRPDPVETVPESVPIKKPCPAPSAKQTPAIPLGKPKSGRVWKDRNKQRFSALVRDKQLCTSWEKKMKAKQEKDLVKQYSLQLKEEKARKKEEKRKRREDNLKRRAENERKAEIVQVIRNTAKIKRMKKKQLRKIEKRDTLALLQKSQKPNTKVKPQKNVKRDSI